MIPNCSKIDNKQTSKSVSSSCFSSVFGFFSFNIERKPWKVTEEHNLTNVSHLKLVTHFSRHLHTLVSVLGQKVAKNAVIFPLGSPVVHIYVLRYISFVKCFADVIVCSVIRILEQRDRECHFFLFSCDLEKKKCTNFLMFENFIEMACMRLLLSIFNVFIACLLFRCIWCSRYDRYYRVDVVTVCTSHF